MASEYRNLLSLLLVISIASCSTTSESTRPSIQSAELNPKLTPVTVKGCSTNFVVQVPPEFRQASGAAELANKTLSLKGMPESSEMLLKDWSNSTNFPRILVVPETKQVSLEQWRSARTELSKGSFQQQKKAMTELLTASLNKNLVFNLDIKDISWDKNANLILMGTGKNMFQIANSNVAWALRVVRLHQGCLAMILVGADARDPNAISESKKLISEISAI